ncbi:flagellar filament capping protein FliD [Nitrococcus mobilis]|uniref:Flagellar hook-associated protein 2 n=1 Tax=Nitrococcus mobilis Nb-231 TaxID=314278 RepID=A4BUD0_9GAMM|nr:flagellar filament capping protein FliD [Nitrococcus mobilis]EAR20644.1 Flagellar hook-associated protein 2 [Nitrococcus mobilis Nb-231]
MAGISSLGIGSGLDIGGLVDKLVAAEQAPVQNRLNRREAQVQAELSAYGNLKSALSGFQDKVQGLSQASDFRVLKATSSNSEAVAVSASSAATVGRLDLEVNQLAQSQAVASAAFATSATPVGSGTLTLRFGTVTTDVDGAVNGFKQNPDKAVATIDIPAAVNSLAGIRDAINNADAGVSASIINDGVGERLIFNTTDTGATNGFVIEVADDDGNNTDAAGLSQLAFNTSATQSQQARAGQDAQLIVNGLAVSRASNQITDLIEGLTLSVQATTTSAARIDVTQDTDTVKEKIQGFVDAFNQLRQQISQLTSFDAEKKQGGVLQGDATVRGIDSRLFRLTTSEIPGLSGRAIRSLADLGITTASDGTLAIDDAKLSGALEAHFDEVGALFGIGGLADGSGFRYVGNTDATRAGEYAVAVTRLAQQASIQGAGIAPPTSEAPLVIDASNDTLQLTVNGVTSESIQLTHGSYTSGSDAAAELQARINGDANLKEAGARVSVAFSGDAFLIASSRYGSESTVTLNSVATNTPSSLGFSSGQTGTGADVEGTIDGAAALGSGRLLAAQEGRADGLKIEITGQSTGPLGTLTFTRGLSDQIDTTLGVYLNGDGLLDSLTESLSERIDAIGEDRDQLAARMEQVRQRYLNQFNAMDALVAQLNTTASFLDNQLPGLERLAQSGGTSGG